MVEAGETGGFLDVVLAQIADFQSREKEIKAKVTTAMLYPIILLVAATGVLIFLMVFFIPRFQKMFADFHAKLPALTEVIIAVSQLMINYGLWIGVGLVVGGFLIRSWIVSEQGRRVWEGFMPHAGDAAWRGRAAGAIARCRPPIHRQPDPGGCGFQLD
jgi:type II secretory pathway component PulF